jgi:hypothetical protein
LSNVFLEQAERLLPQTGNRVMGVIALGAGTGKREAQVCKWLVDNLNLTRLDALILDVSSELLGISLQEFRTRVGQRVNPQFAVMDFESDAGIEKLEFLRAKSEHQPFVFLLLGNTLGVIDEDLFLARMASVMRHQDLMLCELSLATGDEKAGESSAKGDLRAPLICEPLRAIGLNPKHNNLVRVVECEKSKWARVKFFYRFDAHEAALELSVDPRPTIRLGVSVGLSEIKLLTLAHAKEVFSREFSGVKPVVHDYNVLDPAGNNIRMAYIFASRPHAKSADAATESQDKGTHGGLAVTWDDQKLHIIVDGDRCPLILFHYAFLKFLVSAEAGARGSDAHDTVVNWIEQYKEKGGTLKPGECDQFDSMKQAKDVVPGIAALKQAVNISIKTKATKHQNLAAKKLLASWPEKKRWSLRR